MPTDADITSTREAEVKAWTEAMPIAQTLGAKYVAAAGGEAEMRLPFRRELGFGLDGVFPASTVGALVDICGGIAAASLCEPGALLSTTDFAVTMLGPAAGAELVARARVPRPSRGSTLVSTVEVFAAGEESRPCAIGRVTMRAKRS